MSHFCPNMPLGVAKGGKKENLHVHQNWACTCNFCEPNFLEFRLKWWCKELFLHCELNGLGPSWMGLTHGNVLFDILEPQLFKNIAYVGSLKHFPVQFFYMYFATRPRPSLTVHQVMSCISKTQSGRYFYQKYTTGRYFYWQKTIWLMVL